jgi:hypothetical protein
MQHRHDRAIATALIRIAFAAALLSGAAGCRSAPRAQGEKAGTGADAVRAEVLGVEWSRESLVYRIVEIRFSNPGATASRLEHYAVAWPGGRKEAALGEPGLPPGAQRLAHVRVTAADGNLDALTRESARIESLVAQTGSGKPSRPAAAEPQARKEPAMTASLVPDAQSLRALAKKEMPSPQLVPRLSPLLPARWPDPAGAVEWLAYAEEVLPTGDFAARLRGPVAKITWQTPGGKPRAERFAGEPPLLGTVYEGLPPPSLDSAEAALREVAEGRLGAGAAKPALRAYLAWADASPLLGPDLRARYAGFFAWLAAP